jgi:predicted nucleic acid-binding protein
VIVIDASTLANALLDDGPIGQTSRAELAKDPHWVAPPHLPVEVFSAIRGRHRGGKISVQRAHDALDALIGASIEYVRTALLLPGMWQSRHTISGYDAAYVAAAEAHACPLVTADVRLARAAGPRCEIRLAVPGQ